VHLLRLQQGALRLTHSEGTTLLAAGDFVAYRGRRAMQFRHEQNIELMTVVLPVRAVERWLPEWQAAEFVVTKQQAEAGLCFDIARDLLVRSPQLKSDNAAEVVGETVARLIARSLALTSLFDAAEPEELTEAQRRRVKHFCRTNLGSAGLCVDAVARATGLSRASLHRLFRDQAQTLMQWVQLERLEACRRLLLDCGFPQRSLTEIALSQGFKSSAHFSAAFRQRYGTTPREYRATARAGRPSRSTLVRL
jgi:AraC-like DNA-binding protein